MIFMRMGRLCRRSIELVAALLLCLNLAVAQFDSATVLGTVHDSSGAIIGAAKVTLKNVKTGISTVADTDENGNYQFLNVPIGTYTVQAEKAGFRTAAAEQFAVTVSARQRVDLTLQVGGTTETVWCRRQRPHWRPTPATAARW
jgi:Cna protein B-type domain.